MLHLAGVFGFIFVGPFGPGRGLAYLGFREDQNHDGFIAHRNTSCLRERGFGGLGRCRKRVWLCPCSSSSFFIIIEGCAFLSRRDRAKSPRFRKGGFLGNAPIQEIRLNVLCRSQPKNATIRQAFRSGRRLVRHSPRPFSTPPPCPSFRAPVPPRKIPLSCGLPPPLHPRGFLRLTHAPPFS